MSVSRRLGQASLAIVTLLGAAVGACASSGSGEGTESPSPSSSTTTPPTTTNKTDDPIPDQPDKAITKDGQLLFADGAPIVGLDYASGDTKGTTDATGKFTYEDGNTIKFSLGDMIFGEPKGAAILTPYQLAASVTCDDTDPVKVLVGLLETLDQDNNAANGITLPKVTAGGTAKALIQATAEEINAFVAANAPGKTLPAAADGLKAFITVFDAEAYTAGGALEKFAITTAPVRSQGVATDGTNVYFSGNYGFDITDPVTLASKKSNALAIPGELMLAGSDHIGDIDVWNGTIYAPIEDSNGYKHPKIVLYDAASLQAGTQYDIPTTLQSEGVPWVAVDGPRGFAYMAEWTTTPVIHVFDLATMTFKHDIALSKTLGRIQGGKVYKGLLYFSMDDANKTVGKIHLATGMVMDLFTINISTIELEGLVLYPRAADGSMLHTLDIDRSGGKLQANPEYRHFKATKEPLRWKACP
ncbi:Flagellar hook-length control protein FliK [Labilithrix luteola]|uniref:Flagellar hook-length control protein FliK n=1 Tax=Labilithrix luteola TaxID=1391654 RepID=A0A0K1QEP6_9BACT|nr:hypothetical protein [Labilithrix luteola]AKV03905.1 Flagellar hook-length control protein FliK [Labilithrix luteola]